MKVSDYVASFISGLNPRSFEDQRTRVYTVCGAGAMHLNDSICHHPGIQAIAMHQEQAAAMAAEADARVTNGIGVVCVTAGPGGTNALTGIACAWVDSIPMLVIAGQVTSHTMARLGLGERAQGNNELPLVEIAKPVTKYARTVPHASVVRYHLERAVHEAMSGRRGPVFVEIPLDVQNAHIDPERLESYQPEIVARDISSIDAIDALPKANRPVLMIGNGVRLSGAEEALRAFLNRFQMPVVASWGARDIIPDHSCVIGASGLFGDRASNWAVQNADLILAVGTRLSYPQTGHTRELFAPQAKKIVVDIDHNEASKLPGAIPIVTDCKEFFEFALKRLHGRHTVWESWLNACRDRAKANPVMLPEYRENKGGINAYHFIEQLGEHLADDAIVITDVGFSFIPTFQSLKLKPDQRLFHSGGVSPMGWAIPAAVGAAFAAPGRQIVCLTGDGGAMMNLQELQTIAHHKLPISIFVYANDGYATMRLTQENHFKRLAVSNKETGVSCPDWCELAQTFGFRTIGNALMPENLEHLGKWLKWQAPTFIELTMAEGQVIAPRVQSRMKDGKFVPTPIDEMWPYPETQEAAE